ncbi:Phosphotransferase enzyme family protein [Salegentibacter echinorum]|uniref:Phosphotransferase enzyme family protein n=1 Tax=Salegentibacter echinorum TaxID=1073325 RepID=A0A1M5DT69_SALEC|nr:aminoglycoside phosphotransferase family protein [Salegentibacter echinorum]SHF70116.1 Phosphotransferase enzyme family protein [Salegentibacter echinorum]
MNKEHVKSVFEQFEHGTTFKYLKEFTSGHINDTYFIDTEEGEKFVLQRVNHEVFKDVPALVANKVRVSKHLAAKLPELPDAEKKRRVLSFAPASTGEYHLKDDLGKFWNLTYFIDDSKVFDTVTEREVAYEGGKLFGDFIKATDDFDSALLTEVLPGFHDMKNRLGQFEEARSQASEERLAKAKSCIDRVEELREEMVILQNLKEDGQIPVRVTHNDTKISNALFDENNKGLCVIDTDTVMPGIVHYDFGDAIRTICNTAEEDEKDLDKVTFNVDYYEAYLEGFLKELHGSLNETEIKNLPLGAKTIIFIMGLRFLTDYLAGDKYYKTTYPEHNLDRAKNQLKLIESFEAQTAAIEKASESILSQIG